MITRRDVLSEAIDKCVKELYSLAQPHVEFEDFIKQNKEFLAKEREYYNLPEENKPSYREFCGPTPFEFYYLPQDIFKRIVDNYIYAYRLDEQQELLDTIDILKNYCEKPIIDKWIMEKDKNSGYRGYDHPDNLVKEIQNIIKRDYPDINENELASECVSKFFEFLDMAGNFFEWNKYLNAFNTKVYLGGTPSYNKEGVIENWKKYRNKDIKIDESKYKDNDNDANNYGKFEINEISNKEVAEFNVF